MLKAITKIFSLFICFSSVCSTAQNATLLEANSLGLVSVNTKEQATSTTVNSPYVVNFKSELPYLVGTTGLFGIGLVLQRTNKADPFTLGELAMLDRNSINKFDRGATYNNSKTARSTSDILFNFSLVLPTAVILINKHTRNDMLSLFVMSAEAMLISGGLNLNAKHIFNRARPYTFNPSFSNEVRTNSSSRLSFFSGHTSLTATATFFVAKVISDYHPNMSKGVGIGLWTTAVVVPAVTGLLRVESGRHYNTDVIFGYSIGAAVGWLVPYLNKKKSSNLSFMPYIYNGANGLSFILKINQ